MKISHTWLLHQSLLDGNGQLCTEKDARLESRASFAAIDDCKDTLQIIRPFRAKDWSSAEKEAKAQKVEPLGSGKFQGDTHHLGTHVLIWTEHNTWLLENTTTRIEIDPTTDQADVTRWLDVFLPIQAALFEKNLLGNKPVTFELGGKAYSDHNSEILAEAIETLSLVKFPAMKNGRLKAVCMERGAAKDSPIRLEAIILHEIGHLLESYLSEHLGDISRWVHKDLHKLTEVLTEISPHYLKFKQQEWSEKFEAIDREEPVKINGEKLPARKALVKLEREVAHEIFAEAIRHYFLEPQLGGYQTNPPKTGWDEFDSLCWAFCREVRHIERKGSIPTELFPERRRKPTIIPEFVQDWLH